MGTFGVQNMYDIYAHKYHYSVVQIWEQKWSHSRSTNGVRILCKPYTAIKMEYICGYNFLEYKWGTNKVLNTCSVCRYKK